MLEDEREGRAETEIGEEMKRYRGGGERGRRGGERERGRDREADRHEIEIGNRE